MLGTVSSIPERLSAVILNPTRVHNLLCLLEGLRGYNSPGRTLVEEMLLFRDVHLLSSQKVFDLIFVIDQNTAVQWIYENPSDAPWIPFTAKFGFVMLPIQRHTDGSASLTLLNV